MLCCQGALTGFHKAWTQPLGEPIGAISYCSALASLIRLHPLKSLGKCNSAPHITRVKSHPKNRRPGPEDWHGKTINQDEPGSTKSRNSTFPVAHHPPKTTAKIKTSGNHEAQPACWFGGQGLTVFSSLIWMQPQKSKTLETLWKAEMIKQTKPVPTAGFQPEELDSINWV